MFHLYRISAAVPELRIADVGFNAQKIYRCAVKACKNGAEVIVFPELALTGYTCGDLFEQDVLLKESEKAAVKLAEDLRDCAILVVFGLPVRILGKIYDCTISAYKGKILMVTPCFSGSSRMAMSGAFSQVNDFSQIPEYILFGGNQIPFGSLITPAAQTDLIPGIETGHDLFSQITPSSLATRQGANLILNPNAFPAQISDISVLRETVKLQSARCHCVYLSVSSGIYESTTDHVYSGRVVIAENGKIIAENNGFSKTNEIVYADVDTDVLRAENGFEKGSDGQIFPGLDFLHTVAVFDGSLSFKGVDAPKYRKISAMPFLPEDEQEQDLQYPELLRIQSTGLARRIAVTHAQKAVIGISGGLDSTMALLIIRKAFEDSGLDPKNIIAITMPGFGTTARTKDNSVKLAELLGADLRTIDIRKACLQHFQDIGHDPAILNSVYENVQARERTQILMDVANREGGIVVGTGDLSELALGWCTYNGDHMSMYAVNAGITKTQIRSFITWYAKKHGGALGDVLTDVVETPVSPELLPADKTGNIAQKTETILGSYDLHDFYLYHLLKYGASPGKIKFLQNLAFAGRFPEQEISRTLELFLKRFFTQQFKRSCMPDGPAVDHIGLSPRGAWSMPSDASGSLWLNSTGKI